MSEGSDETVRIPGRTLDDEVGVDEINRGPNLKESDEDGQHLSHSSVAAAGSYYLGPVVKRYAKSPVTQCLARKKETDDYYLMKILILKDNTSKDKFQLYRRAVFHTEYTILKFLKGHPGVIQLHDFFKDSVPEELPSDGSEHRVKELKRMCMVLECLIPHGRHNTELISLPEYLTQRRCLSDNEALHIFVNILSVINDLHKINVVHNDLRLSNIILNRRTLRVKLINFYHSKLLSSDTEPADDQHCDPSPDSIAGFSGNGVSTKPFDMWSAGVILYLMMDGYLPLNENPSWGSALTNTRALADLYSKLTTGDSVISVDLTVPDATKKLIRSLLCKDPHVRLKADEALDMACTVLALQAFSQSRNISGSGSNTGTSNSSNINSQYSDQIVPECPTFDEKPDTSSSSCTECWLIVNANAPHAPSKTYKIAISEVESTHKTKATSVRSKSPVANKSSGGMSPGRGSSKTRDSDDRIMRSEKEVLSRRGRSNTSMRRSSMSRSSKIKFAMLRLGATSVNNISALSFNYDDRRSGTHSNM